MNQTLKRWFRIALINFLVATILGALLRFAFIEEIPGVDYRNFLHGHSHVAMLGWIYMALYALLIYQFIPDKLEDLFYQRLFWITQITVFGMMVAFPAQGYGPISTAFSTLHIFCSYAFAFRFIRDLRKSPEKQTIAHKFAKSSLIFMITSTLALFSLPIIRMTPALGSALFYNAIQFFLHFQFNGWFMFAIIAIFLKYLAPGLQLEKDKSLRYFYWLLVISCIMTFALAITWTTPEGYFFAINSIGVTIQLLALYFFVRYVRKQKSLLNRQFKGWTGTAFWIALISFVLKIVVQTAVVVPSIAIIAYTIRNFVIAFIHLIQLGAVTSFVVAMMLIASNTGKVSGKMRAGLILLFSGFILSEFVLGLQGMLIWSGIGFIPGYYLILFLVSVLIPFGVLFINLAFWTRHSNKVRPVT